MHFTTFNHPPQKNQTSLCNHHKGVLWSLCQSCLSCTGKCCATHGILLTTGVLSGTCSLLAGFAWVTLAPEASEVGRAAGDSSTLYTKLPTSAMTVTTTTITDSFEERLIKDYGICFSCFSPSLSIMSKITGRHQSSNASPLGRYQQTNKEWSLK